MKIDIKVNGLKNLHDQLLKVGAEFAEKQLNAALMNASLPAFKEAKQNAPGSIKKAITRRKHRAQKSRKLNVKGIKADGKNAAGISILIIKKNAPHAHLVELGTQRRYTLGKSKKDKKLGRKKRYGAGVHRGIMPANPFLTEAWKNQGELKALGRFRIFLSKRVEKLAKK